MKKINKGSNGRPTKYDEKYCAMITDHMANGLSIESFAALIEVHKDTIYEWKKHWPSFSDAIRKGEAKSLLYWENIGIRGMKGEIPYFSAAIWCFNMKNRFRWRDQPPTDAEVNEKPYETALRNAFEKIKKEEEEKEG